MISYDIIEDTLKINTLKISSKLEEKQRQQAEANHNARKKLNTKTIGLIDIKLVFIETNLSEKTDLKRSVKH